MAAAVLSASRPRSFDRRRRLPGLLQVLGGILALGGFGLGSRTAANAKTDFVLTLANRQATGIDDLHLPSRPTVVVFAVICVVLGVVRLVAVLPRAWQTTASCGYAASFVFAAMTWSAATTGFGSLNLPSVLDGTVIAAVPLILGALGGVVCERSGVVNVAIEGQLLFGAFMTALIGSLTGSLWVGVVAGTLGGALMGLLLAVLAIRYLIEQVVLGVVMNLLALGVTGFLYKAIMANGQAAYNHVALFTPVRIPGLAALPVIGPVLFDQPVLVYVTVALVVAVHFALFRTRWGLRTRSVGEHPAAADTAGIDVLRIRYRNVTFAGLFAGLGGAWLVGEVGGFTESMTNGKGFIALAAVIFGRWSPFGALAAAGLFGFASALTTPLSGLGTPVPSQLLVMLPYLATVFAVAGLVGRVRAPAADGKPYVKR